MTSSFPLWGLRMHRAFDLKPRALDIRSIHHKYGDGDSKTAELLMNMQTISP